MKTRTCAHCKQLLPTSDFYRKGPEGFSCWCRKCHIEREREYRKTPEYIAYRNSRHVKPENNKRLSKLTPIEKCAIGIWTNVKRRAMMNGMPFDLTRDFVINITSDFCKNNYYSLEPKNPFKPSLDKVNPKNGYVKENVKVIWLIENYCKNSFTNDQVVEFCKRKIGLL